jgi:hypothetical protein
MLEKDNIVVKRIIKNRPTGRIRPPTGGLRPSPEIYIDYLAPPTRPYPNYNGNDGKL